jgi:DNA-directed RNA polymerase subunit L
MNQEKMLKFCITSNNGEDMSVEIEGGAKDLTNLLATVISDSEEIEMVVTMALLAVKIKQDNSEDMLSKMMSAIKPVAQA